MPQTAGKARTAAGGGALYIMLAVFLTTACQFLPGGAGDNAAASAGGNAAIRVDVLPPASAVPDTPSDTVLPMADGAQAQGTMQQEGPAARPAGAWNGSERPTEAGPRGMVPDSTVADTVAPDSVTPDGTRRGNIPQVSDPATGQSRTDASPQPAPTPLPPFFAAEQAACLGRGGIYQRVGLGEIRACVFTTRDSGKACTSGADCEGACLARSGTCAPLVPLYGCHEIIQDNGLRTTQCLQ